MASKNFSTIRRKLLRWYDKHRRDLPWRRTRDPYAIWISEIMLQQTQVAAVLPYFEKFLRAFPTVDALDRAPLERVLRVWAGLGYYRRAENLKKAARQIRRIHGGALPRDFHALRQLPGIGEYTAGAIMSIAFRECYAAVDGNVRRVLGRLFALADAKPLAAIASALVSPCRPADFNQALMELGATTCHPQEPQCGRCPLSAECAENKGRRINLRFKRRDQGRFKNVTWPLAIVRRDRRILLRRRGADGLLARLWEFPGGEIPAGLDVLAFLRGELEPLKWQAKKPQLIGEMRHSITDRRIRAPVYLMDCPSTDQFRLPNGGWRWIDLTALHRQAISSMTAKAVKLLAP